MTARVVALRCFPVKAAGGQSLPALEVGADGVVGDRGWAVYDHADKLASGKHSRRFRRMDPVFTLVAGRVGEETVLVLPDGTDLVAGEPGTDEGLSDHFGEPVTLRREGVIPHQDAAPISLVGTATLAELGRYEGDGNPLDPRHVRANIVVETTEPYVEESWVGREVTVGGVRLRVTEPTERCRMVGVAQVDLPERPGMLKAIADHHALVAGVYAEVVTPGRVALGDEVEPS
ncbi:MOSC domain-containing protein [Pedococcus aerophilus]|uniref:MOSC domain-containing protein n=1 Tax=Pedococcus aerophilus TaxID=436356 RepID=A0ABN3UX41_9MICO